MILHFVRNDKIKLFNQSLKGAPTRISVSVRLIAQNSICKEIKKYFKKADQQLEGQWCYLEPLPSNQFSTWYIYSVNKTTH